MSTKSKLELEWEYWSSQLKTFDALDSGKYDLVVFRGGYGSGKTILGVRWVIETALRISKSDNLIIAPDSQKGGPTTYKAFFSELPGENTVPEEGGDPENSPIIADYHSVNRRATFINGSVVRLGSADVWNRYAGGEFNSIYCDEVAHYENTNLYDLHEMLVTRQRTERGPNVTLWTSTGNGYNQFYDITELHETPDGDELTWTDSMNVIQANSLDNPFLPAEAKAKMERQFGGTDRATQALEGGFAAAEGLVYSSFSRTTHVVSETPTLRDERYYAYDHGWKDPRVLLEVGKTTQDQYIILDEFYESEAPVEAGINWLEDKPHGTIYSEHEPEHIEKFRTVGFEAEAAIKDIDEGIPVVREFLEVDESGRPGLLVHERCENVVKEFLSYKREHVGKSHATDHAMDCTRYLLCTRELDSSPDLLLGYE
jgi:phage terminase large subunit